MSTHTTNEQSTRDSLGKIIRIYHECEGRIEKFVPRITVWNHEASEIKRICHKSEGRIETSVQRITVWHHQACRVMTNGDPEGWIFLFYPHTKIISSFSCSPVFFLFQNKLPEVPEYAKMQLHMMTSLKHNNDVT